MFQGPMTDGRGGGSGGGIGGSTGATDNAILRADGTGGATVQSSAVTIDDTTGTLNLPSAQKMIWNGDVSVGRNSAYALEVINSTAGGGKLLLSGGEGDVIARVKGQTRLSIDAGTAGYIETTIGNSNSFMFNRAGGGQVGIRPLANGSVFFGIVGSEGASQMGGWLSSVLVEANTAGSGAPNVLAATESGTVLTNEGATAENYHTLPTAVAGYQFTFICQDTDGIRVVANTGDTISLGGTVSASAGYIKSVTADSSVTLVAINATQWIATSIVGTWTVDS